MPKKPAVRFRTLFLALATTLSLATAVHAFAAAQSDESLSPGPIEPPELPDTAAPSPFEASPPPASQDIYPVEPEIPETNQKSVLDPERASAPEANLNEAETAPAPEPETPAVQVAEPTAAPNIEPPTEIAPLPPGKKYEEETPKKIAKREREKTLATPTRSVELYEKARRDHMWERSRPSWSANLGIAPRAFGRADLRVPLSNAGNDANPTLTGLLFAGERVLMTNYGQLQVGGEFGYFGAPHRDNFSNLFGAIMTLEPYLQYEGLYVPRQIVAPTIKAGYEFARINYSYKDNKVNDVRAIPRLDLGLLVYLNFFEPSAAGYMEGNYDVKRTYLAAYYTLSSDPSQKDIDLSDRGAWRLGFRFEF